ncbi:MAG: PPOX class F420-dependent oxidoreductase [Candidatus Dormibacteraeota bacterium]|nr:PPOX class F420-dependent oxidoreductase [Candidatus Dormibacteraeota bacterium]MBV8301918.1 PPOX class F420-dependent oxidoreductase [Candidatus Dormibacteraeota bacterium]
MGTFTEKELAYLRDQRLARIATADSRGRPHVVPVGFRISEDETDIEVGGHGFADSMKYRDMRANPQVAIVIDDLVSVNPWTPRGVEVRGKAELQDSGGTDRFGPGWDASWVRIVPERVISWGIEAPAFSEGNRKSRSIART